MAQGQQLQLVVKGGCWKASYLEQGEYGLISEAVTPAFEYRDMKLIDEAAIKATFPYLWPSLKALIKS